MARRQFDVNWEKRVTEYERVHRDKKGNISIKHYVSIKYYDNGRLVTGWGGNRLVATEAFEVGPKSVPWKGHFTAGQMQLDNGFANLMKKLTMSGGITPEQAKAMSLEWEYLTPKEKEMVYEAYHHYLGESYSSDGIGDDRAENDRNHKVVATPSDYAGWLEKSLTYANTGVLEDR